MELPKPLTDRPMLFAHRGAPLTKAEENTLTAFRRALAAGARGLEGDIGLTGDGVPVLTHPRILPWRRIRVERLSHAELPPDMPTLGDFYRSCGTDFDLALDMAAPSAAEEVVRIAAGHGAAHRLWLTYWRLPTLAEWRERWPEAHLVYPAMPIRHAGRLVERLAAAGVDALNVHHRFCRPALVTLAHDHGLRLFVWGVKRERALQRALVLGADGAFCDDLDAIAHVVESRGR